jgi:putative transposase
LFCRSLALAGLQTPQGSYERLWTPLITLWYLIWQWLQPKHTLDRVVLDARRGGADRLCRPTKRLSRGIQSKATTAYSDARQRLPLEWVRQCFGQLAAALLLLGQGPGRPELAVELLDGSTKRLRPHGDMGQHFPAHRTRRKRAYWCVARVLVSFCARTGLATAARIASLHVSEQALAVQLILEAAKRVLYIGDRNFGVWRVVRAAVQGGSQALVRLTQVRARRLLGRKHLPALVDRRLVWSPSAHDQVDPGLQKQPVTGRLIILRAHRRGYRPQTLYLFTTLADTQAYPPERLLELYGWRWRVELNFRTVKSTMQMDQSEAKSADMVCKEFYAGLMAYNLVCALMAAAAQASGCHPLELSFTKVQGLLASALTELFLTCMSGPARQGRLQWLLAEAAAARLPRRRKPRPNEPRAQYHKPQVFPPLKTSRQEARDALQKLISKS